MEHTDRVLYCRFGSYALYRLYDDFLGLGISIQFCLVHDFINVALCIRPCLVLQAFYQTALCLFCTQAREFFKFGTFLQLHFLKFFLLDAQQFLLVVNALLTLLYFLFPTADFFLTLVQRYLTLFQPVFVLLDLLVALLHFLLQFRLFVQEFLLHLKQFLFFHYVGLLIGGLHHLRIFSF